MQRVAGNDEPRPQDTAQDSDGRTALHIAVQSGNLDIVDLLIRDMRKEEKLKPDKSRRTPLTVAQQEGSETIMRKLLEKFLIPTFGSSQMEREALYWASKSRRRHDIAMLLLSKGKQPDESSPLFVPKGERDDWTAISWAAYLRRPLILWTLLANASCDEETKKPRLAALQMMQKLADKIPAERDCKNIIQDILQDPPTIYYRASERFTMPSMDGVDPRLLGKVEAAVVLFSAGRTESFPMKRSVSVKELIYDSGPQKIAGDIEYLRRRMRAEYVTEIEVEEKEKEGFETIFHDNVSTEFIWIHLPSTNASLKSMNQLY